MKPNAKVSLLVNEVSMHVHNANFDVVPYSDAEPFSIVRGWGHDSIFNVVLYTLEDAVSLLQAASEVVEFFTELEAATEGGEQE